LTLGLAVVGFFVSAFDAPNNSFKLLGALPPAFLLLFSKNFIQIIYIKKAI